VLLAPGSNWGAGRHDICPKEIIVWWSKMDNDLNYCTIIVVISVVKGNNGFYKNSIREF
jgi:hypothetical protein